MSKRLITVADIREAARSGKKTLLTPSDECIVTPMARDEADVLEVSLNDTPGSCPASPKCPAGIPAFNVEEVIRQVSALLKTRLPAGISAEKLEAEVREAVAVKLGTAVNRTVPAPVQRDKTAQGVRIIDGQRLIKDAGGSVTVDEKALVANAIGGAKDDKLAGGYMVWEHASFSRQVDLPEIAVVIEGELNLNVDGTTLVGRPGDMIYFPKGAVVEYSTPSRVKLACVNCI
jgi:ethanolamine utilization protein EutQ